MKFFIAKESATGIALEKLFAQIRVYRKQAHSLQTKYGAKGRTEPHSSIGGGATSFQFSSKPQHWKSYQDDCYRPIKGRKAVAHILEEMDALPFATDDDMNAIVGYESQTVGRRRIFTPSVQCVKKGFAMQVDEETKYKPKSDIVEITTSEYQRLTKQKK